MTPRYCFQNARYDFTDNEQPHLDILIGLDHYWERCDKLDCGLVCQDSVYGWLISGCVKDSNSSSTYVIVSHQLL